MQDKIGDMEFLMCLKFETLKNLEVCLLVFDDSCEEVYKEKEFVKHAVSGRHKKENCKFVKHILFHQSKWSRTIDPNTTHIIVFISPPCSANWCFWKTVEQNKINQRLLKKAKIEPFEQSMIDFDPRTSGFLRSYSKIMGPSAIDFYNPPSLAKETPLTNEREKLIMLMHILKNWQKNKELKHLRKLLQSCSHNTINFLCKCAVNIIIEKIHFSFENLLNIQEHWMCWMNQKLMKRRIFRLNSNVNLKGKKGGSIKN